MRIERRAKGEALVEEERKREEEEEEECAPRKVPDREKRERGPRRSAKKTFLEWNAKWWRSADGRNRNRETRRLFDTVETISNKSLALFIELYIYIYIYTRSQSIEIDKDRDRD